MKGHILDLRLIHHTDAPFSKMSEEMKNQLFFGQASLAASIKEKAEKFRHAKLYFEAPIVQSIKMLPNKDQTDLV